MQNFRLYGAGLLAGFALACSEPAIPPLSVDGGGGAGGSGGEGGEGGAGAGDVGVEPPPAGNGIGEACGAEDGCRPGLACDAGTCLAAGTLEQGDRCVLAVECGEGLRCVGRTCLAQQAGAGATGTACESDLDCTGGHRCAVDGFAVQCLPEGETDVGGSCVSSVDCYAGLGCFGERCNPPPPGVPPFLGGPFQTTIECEEAAGGAATAHFDIPGGPDHAGADFFRLPHPNDANLDAQGKPDFSTFPVPGAGLLGFDPVQRYLDAITRDFTGWSSAPTVIFRFSGAIDFESFRTPEGETARTRWVDVTPGDDLNGRALGHGWFSFGRGNSYVCDNWFAVRRGAGLPLTPGHTYAVWLTRTARDAENRAIQRAPHFDAMLGAAAPADARLARAWESYAPLRAHLEAEGTDPDTLLVATVFTVAPVRDLMSEVAAAARALPVPEAGDWVRCDAGVESPCPQAEGERACGAPTDAYEEYHALLTLPVFQEGTAPYLTPDDGGDVRGGEPVRSERVCLSLTVPLGDMPDEGWPITVYAHGTGGGFRTHVKSSVAGTLSAAGVPGRTVPMMVLGIDQVQHGPRRGDSERDPKDLFFNFANPVAARGNPIQGGADQVSLARFAAALDVTAEQSGGRALRTNPAAVVFFGQSQGSLHGSLGLPFAPEIGAVVLSGNGGGLIHALINKRNPVDIARALPHVINDADGEGLLNGGEGRHNHPVLALLQSWTDPADPLNFARMLAFEPPEGVAAKHVFQPYGLGDTFTPNVTIRHFAVSAGLEEVEADRSASPPDDLGFEPQPSPLAGNVRLDGVDLTLVLRQYGPPAGVDGHHVSFEAPVANSDVARFLGMAASGQQPQVGR